MRIIKNILFNIINILIIPLTSINIFGIIGYILPNIQTLKVGQFILKYININNIIGLIFISLILNLILNIISILISKNINVKNKNLYIKLNTGLNGLGGIVLAIYTFIKVNPLVAEKVIITITRKINIGICLSLLILFHLLWPKVKTIVNRKIQAYDTAKETNTIGRSSIIFVNILKVFEVLFPELLVLLIIIFCVNGSVASYFIITLSMCILPLIGNIIADINTRREIKKKQEIEKDILAEKIANNLR